MNRFTTGFLFVFTIICLNVHGQNSPENSLDSFSAKFITTLRNYQHPRAWLVTDKSVFKAGETIWLRAFLLNAFSQRSYRKSNFLFVDIVSEKDTVINTIILDAANQQLNAKIVLPAFIPAGYYWLRAYTRQMAEKDVESVYVQPIYILNGNIAPRTRRWPGGQDSLPVVSFFPEGNNIITGVASVVALQINQKNGDALQLDGDVKDNRDSVITRFKTNTDGLAKFAFEPSGYRKYKAVINWHGRELSYPLPSFNFFGGQISATKEQQNIKLRVLLGDSIYRKDAPSYIVGIAKDSLVYGSIGKGQYEVAIAEQALPPGITTFYLFDKTFRLLSERSVYVDKQWLQVNVTTDKLVYAPRDKVALDISITDAQKQIVPALLQVSVTDTLLTAQDMQGSLPVCPEKNIDNILMAQYSTLTAEETDLVMLTKNPGYQSVITSSMIHYTDDNDSVLYIKGTVFDAKKQPAANKLVSLISRSNATMSLQDTTDTKGRFRFPVAAYYDSTEFIIEVKNMEGKSFENFVLRDPLKYPKFTTPVCLKKYLQLQTLQIRKFFKSYPDDLPVDEGKSLQPVTVTSTVKNYDDSRRLSANSTILGPDKINVRNSIVNAILSVGGIMQLNGFLVMLGPSELIQQIGPQSEPVLLLNGVQMQSGSSSIVNYINQLNPRDIEFIEVLKGPEAAILGAQGGNGAINIVSKTSQQELLAGGAGLKTFYAKGIANPALFPVPAYDKKNKKAITAPDIRSTLFWSGNYLADEAHKPSLVFYTNDVPSVYKITVTGVTTRGDIINKTITITNR